MDFMYSCFFGAMSVFLPYGSRFAGLTWVDLFSLNKTRKNNDNTSHIPWGFQ